MSDQLLRQLNSIQQQLDQARTAIAGERGIYLPPGHGKVRAAVDQAAYAFGVSPSSVLGQRRDGEVMRARQAAYWLAREAFGLSLTHIGRDIGARDHTTILNGVRRAEQLRATDPVFRLVTDRLRDLLNPPETEEEPPCPQQ